MKVAVLGFLAETPIHPGSGRSVGVIDLPVTRESTTGYPVIPGSSLKGSLRDKAESIVDKDQRKRFGDQERAGDLLVSDGRLLLLPVRSLTGAMKWATCPYLIERLHRDLVRAGAKRSLKVPSVESDSVLARGSGTLLLEERQFDISGPPPGDVIDTVSSFVLHDETKKRLERQLVILSDDDFSWFAQYGLPIQARNKLDDDTKKSKNLWYEETLASDTIMYSLVITRSVDGLSYIKDLFSGKNRPYLQVGGNETTGQGWFAVTVHISSTGDNQVEGDVK